MYTEVQSGKWRELERVRKLKSIIEKKTRKVKLKAKWNEQLTLR